MLATVFAAGRRSLYEHEVYALLAACGFARLPRHLFLSAGATASPDQLAELPGSRVVVKLVSESAHKTELGGVKIVERSQAAIETASREILAAAARAGVTPTGVLCCEYIEHSAAFGAELFVGLRATREFGPVVAAGLGGIHTEYLAAAMQPGKAAVMVAAELSNGRELFDLFRQTAAYQALSGSLRGTKCEIDDDTFVTCFDAFIELGRRFAGDKANGPCRIAELEVNPFAAADRALVPLDGVCRLMDATEPRMPRPIALVDQLLHPKSIAVIGVSARHQNMGRIILRNILAAGFDPKCVTVIKPDAAQVDGIACAASLSDLSHEVDLLVVAVDAAQAPQVAADAIDSRKVQSVILIPGGMGETAGGKSHEDALRRRIAQARRKCPDAGPVFLGGNCLGIISRPGHYDTMFIPEDKLPKERSANARRVAIVSQSGAFAITRQSSAGWLNPAYVISLGNQVDLTVSDVCHYLVDTDRVDVLGIYVEGFQDGDGLELCRVIQQAVRGRKRVVAYKAGRTPAGRAAAAGHTASIAGDYAVCEAALGHAGALVVQSFTEFQQQLQLATLLYGRVIRGGRLAMISNAGYEVVGMADALAAAGSVQLAELPAQTLSAIANVLQKFKLDNLVNVRNPLDLTPMATDAAFESSVRVMLECPEVDAVIVAFVPLTPAMKTTASELSDPASLAHRLPALSGETDQQVVVVIDSGPIFDPLAETLRDRGLPVFRSADDAVQALGRYIEHSCRMAASG